MPKELNDASLILSQIRAIADLVAQADRDAVFDDAIELAMHTICDLAMEGKEIVEASLPKLRKLEVVNG